MNNIQEILNIVKEHKFYEKEICADLLAFHLGILYKNPESNLIYNNKDIAGFYIKSNLIESENICLNYFFILPKFRRLGIFTEFIKRLQFV